MKYSWKRGGGYEVSSKGDKRFSAFWAILPDGRSIEQVYQCDIKGYDPGGTNWKLGKGKPPLDTTVDLWKEYLGLWKIWAKENLDLMNELRIRANKHGRVLSDLFGWTPINQAHALSEILNETSFQEPTVIHTLLETPVSHLNETKGTTNVQAEILGNGVPGAFNAILYPPQHQSTAHWIQNRIQGLADSFGGFVNEQTKAFFDHARHMYQAAMSSGAMNAARLALNKAGSFMHQNQIVPIDDFRQLQTAQPIMQRYLMADPVVRKHYFAQRIDGYADTYRNMHGRDVGLSHYDCRRVVDGIAWTPQEHAELMGKPYVQSDDEPGFIVEEFFEPLIDDDRELLFLEKVDIINAWELQRAILAGGVDTTNPFGGDVGA